MTMTVRFDPAAPYEVDQEDVVFAKPDGKELLARVYRPRGEAAAPLMALVDVHGGAWNRGDHTSGAVHGKALAASGLVVVSLGFRQGPEHQYRAASQDVAAGVRYVRAHARRLSIDPARVGLIGSSSGGQLVLLAGVKPGAPEHAGTPIVLPNGSLDTSPGDESVRFVVALYPVADPLARYRYAESRLNDAGFDAKRFIESHRAFFPDEAAMESVSITRIVAAKEATTLPPVWVAQPEVDDNVPAEITAAFVRAYRAAGGHLDLVPFPGAKHGFIGQASPATDKALSLIRDFVGKFGA